MRPLRSLVFPLAIVLIAIATLPPDEASAIPAFARKYQFSCSVCHAPFPRLKPFGEEFAARGFRLEDPSQEPTRAQYDTGDPLLKLWRDLPLAIRMEGFAAYRENEPAELTTEYPWVFKILSGGPLSDDISYYLYFIVEENDVAGLEDAFVQKKRLFGARNLEMVFGQFQVTDPVFKRELRLERNDFAIYNTEVGLSDIKLTYDRGFVFTYDTPTSTAIVVEVLNGNGIPSGSFDKDNYKNFVLRIAQDIGKTARVGVLGYWGKEKGVDGDGGATNKVTVFGPDLMVGLGEKWQLNATYLARKDEDPYFVGGDPECVETKGGFAELHFFPKGQDGRWAWSLLYNNVDSDADESVAENVSLTMNYLLARNIRFLIEAGRDLNSDSNQASAGLIVAF